MHVSKTSCNSDSVSVSLADQARSIWQRMAADTKLRAVLQHQSPRTSTYASFSVGNLVYYYAGASDQRWRGPGVVVGLNTLSKYVYIDHSGTLVHAHYGHVREANDQDFLREQLENSLIDVGEGNLERDSKDPRFHSSFDKIAASYPKITQYFKVL